MTNQYQPNTEVPSGIAEEDDERRKMLAELRESVESNPKIKDKEKKELLARLNRFTAIEIEKTRQEMLQDGKALMKDQKKQEKPKN